MHEDQIERCLLLCQRARHLQGHPLNKTLDELTLSLQAMASDHFPANQDALQLNAQRIIAQLQEPIISFDLNGYLTGWNKGAENLFGYSSAEAIGQHILFLYANDDGDTGDMPELFLEDGNAYIEVRRRKKSGEVFRAGLSLSVIRDEDNEAVGMVAHLSEITEDLSSINKLKLHASIIEDSDQGILITDGHERIMSVNAAFTRITGYTADEAIGQTTDLLRSGVHDADFRNQVLSAMQGGGPWQGEIIGKRKSGELFPQSVSISVVRNDKGEIDHAFSIFSDISVLRAAEERMQRLVNYDDLTGLCHRIYSLCSRLGLGANRFVSHLVVPDQREQSVYVV